MSLPLLLTVTDWERVTAREVCEPEREGRPIVGVDLGGGAGLERSGCCVEQRVCRMRVAVAPGNS